MTWILLALLWMIVGVTAWRDWQQRRLVRALVKLFHERGAHWQAHRLRHAFLPQDCPTREDLDNERAWREERWRAPSRRYVAHSREERYDPICCGMAQIGASEAETIAVLLKSLQSTRDQCRRTAETTSFAVLSRRHEAAVEIDKDNA